MRASNHGGSHLEHLKITFIRNQNTFPLHRHLVNYFFVNAMRCFFIRSVKSGFLAALRLGKPSLFAGDAVWCRLQHFPAVLDANFLAPGLSVVDFFAPPFLLKCPSHLMSSFFVRLQICAWGLYWEEAVWLRLEASLLLTWLFHYKHIFLLWKLSLVSRQEF